MCGSGNPYYLLCGDCRQRYMADNHSGALKTSDSWHDNPSRIPYAKLLLLAPDLLGAIAIDHGECNIFSNITILSEPHVINGYID